MDQPRSTGWPDIRIGHTRNERLHLGAEGCTDMDIELLNATNFDRTCQKGRHTAPEYARIVDIRYDFAHSRKSRKHAWPNSPTDRSVR
jgi:hypothetical protein